MTRNAVIHAAHASMSLATRRDVMVRQSKSFLFPFRGFFLGCLFLFLGSNAGAADRLVGAHSAQVLSQSMPWIAQDAGLFKKYDLDFRLVFIPSSPVATAATLGGDAEIQVT